MAEPGFISCEDELPHLFGVFNPAASTTALYMMVMPISLVYRSMIQEASATVLSLKIQTVALLALFCGNLYIHMNGGRHIFDRMHSYYVFSSAYTILNHVVRRKPFSDIPLILLLVFWACFQVHLIRTSDGNWQEEEQYYKPLEGICNLFIVASMGYKSWNVPALKSWWLTCVGALVAVGCTVGMEPHICRAPRTLARLYHTLIDHGVVTFLFYQVVGLHFALIRHHQKQKV